MTTLAAFLALLSALLQGPGLAPREATWAELERGRFDTRWLVPPADPAEMAAAGVGALDLEAELLRLLELRFEPGHGDGALARARSFGDLAACFESMRADRKSQDAALGRLSAERPALWAAVGWALGELVRERRFLSRRWDPDEDRDDDGFLIAAPRDLARIEGGPWRGVKGSTLAVQVATLIRADLVAVKAAENDFRTWPQRIGANYESIRVVPGSYLRGTDAVGRPFAALQVRFRSSLPFPFRHYDCDLQMLHRLDERGHLKSDVHSPSADFYWLAGRDGFLPVLDSEGGFVGLLCVRVFGCDLRGVPDELGHKEAGAREGVGNMKREAERLWQARSERAAVYRGAVPEFEVHSP